MRKLIIAALGLGIALGTVAPSYAGDDKKKDDKKTEKKGCSTPGPCAGKAD